MLECAGAINEPFFRATVESLAVKGFLQKGYEYINLDDCWMDTKRDANGDLQWGPNFPTGNTLGEFVHSKGFKFGVSHVWRQHQPGTIQRGFAASDS